MSHATSFDYVVAHVVSVWRWWDSVGGNGSLSECVCVCVCVGKGGGGGRLCACACDVAICVSLFVFAILLNTLFNLHKKQRTFI